MLTNYVQKVRAFLMRKPRALTEGYHPPVPGRYTPPHDWPGDADGHEATGYHPPLPEPKRTPPMPSVKPPGNEQP